MDGGARTKTRGVGSGSGVDSERHLETKRGHAEERPASLLSEPKFGPDPGTKLGEETQKSRNSCSLIGGGVKA